MKAGPLKHGTAGGYKRCGPPRCEACKEYKRDYQRVYRTGDEGPGHNLIGNGSEHGTRSCYVRGCRRPECTKANREYQLEYMRGFRERQREEKAWLEQDGK